MEKKVCHMTSAHPQEDIRIFHKECVSLANNGYEVFLVSCGKTYEKNGVHIIGIDVSSKGRLSRMTKTARAIYKTALKLDADIYHFHDPELLPFGAKLKKKGKVVIFDSHEDVPAQIMDKNWIPKIIRSLVSQVYKRYESYVTKKIDVVITATEFIAKQFNNRARKTATVYNYPKLEDISFHNVSFSEKDPIVCYAGGLSELRGEKVMIETMKGVRAKLIIAGPHEKTDSICFPEGGCVQYVGQLSREEVNSLYGKSLVGLVVLLPAKNYINSLPIKMFEYMAAGIPFISSDFPLWKEITNDTKAGICVDVNDIAMIQQNLNYLINHRDVAQTMGLRGREMVERKYNWGISEHTLLKVYNEFS